MAPHSDDLNVAIFSALADPEGHAIINRIVATIRDSVPLHARPGLLHDIGALGRFSFTSGFDAGVIEQLTTVHTEKRT